MGTIAKVTAGGQTHLIASTAYATCSTAANSAAKVATIQDSQAFTLIDGITVHVYFTYSNTASSPTLNVNSTGAKSIYKYGNTAAGTNENESWPAGSVVSFTYNKNGASGGCWTINNFQSAASQLNADWNASTGVSSILNKPTIPAAQVNADWNSSTGVASILNKPSIPSTYSDVGAASATHSHGHITSDGKVTYSTTATSGYHLIKGSSQGELYLGPTFGTSATSFLANDGTWQTPVGGMVTLYYGAAISSAQRAELYTQLYVNKMPCYLSIDDDGVGRIMSAALQYIYVDEYTTDTVRGLEFFSANALEEFGELAIYRWDQDNSATNNGWSIEYKKIKDSFIASTTVASSTTYDAIRSAFYTDKKFVRVQDVNANQYKLYAFPITFTDESEQGRYKAQFGGVFVDNGFKFKVYEFDDGARAWTSYQCEATAAINSSSTNNQLVTAKAVYDLVIGAMDSYY